MSENANKSWSRPWSIDEIIQNSPNWSLAGDAGLLKYLESFSEDLLARADDTNRNVNKLVDGLNKASLSLDMVTSEFSSLRNIQFIESRVYEDDETLASNENVQKDYEGEKREEESLPHIKEAIMAGINVVNKYFDKVEVPVSDTEDETDFPNFVLRPKDLYIDRPLPYVIGTEEWHKKWHVGLLDSSSDSEVEKVSEKFSDSDSDDDLSNKNKVPIKRLSNSGSEVDMLDRLDIKYPVANSTFDDSSKPTDILGSSNSEEYHIVPAPRSFAEELSAKLGNVVDQTIKVNEPDINRRPIQQATVTSKTIVAGNIFFDEPPPIDEEDELFGSSNKGIFSGGDGLFDDFDKDLSFQKEKVDTAKQVTRPQIPNLFDDDDNEDFFTLSNQDKVLPKISGGLFDDDEEDLFQENINNGMKSYLEPAPKISMPYFDDEPPALEPKTIILKKPIGGIKVIENETMANLLKNRRQESSDSSVDETPSVLPINKNENLINTKKESAEGKSKYLSLFDDDDCLDFEDDLFSNISKKFSSSLFDKDPIVEQFNEVEDTKEIIASVEKDHVIQPGSEQLEKKSSLFEDLETNSKLNNFDVQLKEDVPECDQNPPDLDENWDIKSDNNLFNDDDDRLFANIQEISTRRSGLFDSEPPSLLNETSGIIPDPSTRVETDDSFNPYASSSRRLSSDIFNDQQSNDSFFITKQDSLNIQSQLQSIPEKEGSNKSILEITPSGDDDELFGEITVSADEKSNQEKVPDPLFDAPKNKKEELKNISDKEEESIMKKIGSPGKLKHNLNINVAALVPGVSPPKRREVASSVEDSVTTILAKPILSRVSGKGGCETDKPSLNSNFDNQSNIPEVLSSVTKDRARIPIKRRPSTRKARQEAIRKSMTDFKINVESCSTEEQNDVIMTQDTIEDKKDTFVDIFEENNVDLFSSLNVIKSEISETDRQGIVNNNNNINNKPYQSENVSKTNVTIADNCSVINSDSFESANFKKSDLFEDSEDFDIFGSKKLPTKSNILKKSLFEDDDEDDLFGPSTTSKMPKPVPTGPSKLLESNPTKSLHIKKLGNLEAAEDPLRLFDDDGDDDD